MTPTPRSEPGGLTDALASVRTQWRRGQRYVTAKLSWSRLYRALSYARSALWIVPFAAIILVLAVAPAIRSLDAQLGWRVTGLGVEGARTLYQSVITLTLSFVVFTFGSLLVAIQIASGQLTPRVIATTLLRDTVVKYSVGLFVFSLIFAITALNRLEAEAHEFTALVTACLGIACIVTFLFFIDYTARLLRPVSILARVSDEGLDVIRALYPEPAAAGGDEPAAFPDLPDAPRRIVPHTGKSQNVLAVDLERLMREARRTRGVVEFAPQMGDFVATDEPLFVLYGGATAIDDRTLRAAVAFGPERTMEQDPLFSFRILVDIALKALSPAINDPTTAVLAIDQIHRLLRTVGKHQLRGEAMVDSLGQRRVVFRTPNWEDFVQLACTEIRHCGANNVQVARRLRAMLDNLVASLPTYRRQALADERRRLDQAIATLFANPDDLALARISDSQGLGGSSGMRPLG